MEIYDFDIEDRMQQLRESYNYVEEIRNSWSENRADYRQFATNINVDFQAIQTCCDTFERNLLIDIYTYAEQLFKNFYYELIEKDRTQNKYIKTYFNFRLNAEKFSPNVKYSEIEKNISLELIQNFKFIIKKSEMK